MPEWFADEDSIFAVGFELSVGRENGAFEGLYSVSAARAAVDAWKRSLDCTVGELVAAVNTLAGDAPTKDTPDTPASKETMRRFALELEVLTGRNEQEVAVSTIDDLCFLHRVSAKYDSEPGKQAADESKAALRNLQMAAMQIEESHANG
jgi:hypothetical protein